MENTSQRFDNRDIIKTGDVILCSGNSPTGFLLRTAVSTVWNHSGIGMRFIETIDKTDPSKISRRLSLNTEGKLYIYETNVDKRYDPIAQKITKGSGFSDVDYVFAKYNSIAVRPLKDIFRNPRFVKLTWEFILANRGSTFPSSSLPFLEVWMGVSMTDKDITNNNMFCSELMAKYYLYTIGSQYTELTKQPFDNKLESLFGHGFPNEANMITPEHFTIDKSPRAPIFQGGEVIIHKIPSDLGYVIIQPFILIIFVIVVIRILLD